MKNFIPIGLILLVVNAFSQKQELKPFNSINAFGPFQIELIPSDKEAIELDAFNIESEDLVMELKKGELRLKIKSRHYWSDWNDNKRKKPQFVKTRIYYKQLDELHASAGATVQSSEPIRAKKFLVVGGMGAEINLKIVSELVFAKSKMGASVNLEGQTTYLEVDADMGGSIRASQLESKSAYVSASMGSDVSIYASEEIDIAATFGSDVRYSGDPVVRHTNRKMGSDIHKR